MRHGCWKDTGVGCLRRCRVLQRLSLRSFRDSQPIAGQTICGCQMSKVFSSARFAATAVLTFGQTLVVCEERPSNGRHVGKARAVGVSGHRGSPRRAPEASPPIFNPVAAARARTLTLNGCDGKLTAHLRGCLFDRVDARMGDDDRRRGASAWPTKRSRGDAPKSAGAKRRQQKEAAAGASTHAASSLPSTRN